MKINQNRRELPEVKRRRVQGELGMRIRAIRQTKGLPQDILARECGMCPASFSQIERGHTNLKLDALLLIAKGMKTTIADLFTGIA